MNIHIYLSLQNFRSDFIYNGPQHTSTHAWGLICTQFNDNSLYKVLTGSPLTMTFKPLFFKGEIASI